MSVKTRYTKLNFNQLESEPDTSGDFWIIGKTEHSGGNTYYIDLYITDRQPKTNMGNKEIDEGWLGSESANRYISRDAYGKHESYQAAVQALKRLYKQFLKEEKRTNK
jgi:hypothetical protein